MEFEIGPLINYHKQKLSWGIFKAIIEGLIEEENNLNWFHSIWDIIKRN
jgi:hypothetical protein